MRERLVRLKLVLWTLVGVLVAVSMVRYTRGLGAVTHLSDATPWGLWIGFDVMSGVALAAGGFVMAATVYIFHLERYHAFARPAVLTAFLGYAAVAVGLLYDLGLPWRIWHPLFHWQHHSVLFEVAMCVMLYLTVLALEFAPAILEHPLFRWRPFRTTLAALRKVTIPLVILGIMLSTLHQSSLGSLFLITPYRLHPLWYSPIIYVLFFVSAVALGLSMVVTESMFAHRFLGHALHRRQMSGLGAAAAVVLTLYLALRLGDLAARGVLVSALQPSWHGVLFVAELALSAGIPVVLMAIPRVRNSIRGVGVAGAMTVAGMILYRLDVSVVAFARPADMPYFPSWEELAVSVGIVSAFMLVFIFFVEHLRVYDDVSADTVRARPRSFEPTTVHGLLPPRLAGPHLNSGMALAGFVIALLFLPLSGARPRPVPVADARSVAGTISERPGQARLLALAGAASETLHAHAVSPASNVPGGAGETEAAGGTGGPGMMDPGEAVLLLIDGGRDRNAVLFDHDAHVERAGGDDGCGTCHHLNLPLEEASRCGACHRDMYDSTAVFDHASHVEALAGNDGCQQCHAPGIATRTYATSTACMECHARDAGQSAIIPAAQERWRAAPGYMDAMHGVCIACHEEALRSEPGEHPENLARCETCHDADRSGALQQLEPARTTAASTPLRSPGPTATDVARAATRERQPGTEGGSLP